MSFIGVDKSPVEQDLGQDGVGLNPADVVPTDQVRTQSCLWSAALNVQFQYRYPQIRECLEATNTTLHHHLFMAEFV
jgi:hypothetical protein